MKNAKQVIVICLVLLEVSPARAGKIETTLTVLTSLDTHQSYIWFAPGYASTHCEGQATGGASGTEHGFLLQQRGWAGGVADPCTLSGAL